MSVFATVIRSMGFTDWNQEPELHKEIIIAAQTKVHPERDVMLGLEFLRGVYTTWIKGPATEGCGMYSGLITAKDPAAAFDWKTQMVVLVDIKIEIAGTLRPGVLPSEVYEKTWWRYANPHDIVGRGSYPSRIKHKGEFFPERAQPVTAN